MKKETPFLDFYYECLDTGQIPGYGLCDCGLPKHIFNRVKPTEYLGEVLYWGYGGSYSAYYACSSDDRKCKFTNLRQTIVLLCAAINNEL